MDMSDTGSTASRSRSADDLRDSSFDIAVVGGGPTGSLAALAATKAGLSVALVAPVAPADPRTTALLMPSVALLEEHGAWQDAAAFAAPLVTMRLIDDTGRIPRAPELAFAASEVGLPAFGYNVPNEALNRALAARVHDAGIIRYETVADALNDDDRAAGEAIVKTRLGEVRARLVVAADGVNSQIRTEAGIGARRWSYDQSALVTTLSHERPHADTSVEFHTDVGPFTLVPLPGDRSSLVFVSRPADAERRMALDPVALAREIEGRAHSIFGRMRVDGPRGLIAMEGLVAQKFGTGRVVLVGEAGHRFPPIGAQGLNLGYRDVATLAELMRSVPLDGLPAAYDLRRRADVALRTLSVDVLNRSLLTDLAVPTVLRAAGLTLARNSGPLRRTMMRFGLGAV